MQTVCNKVACINERGNITVAVVVVLLFSSVLSRPLLACNVTKVDLHVGSTPTIACEDDLTTAYVGNPFYTCVEWAADLPDDDPFEYFYEEDIGEEEWQSKTEVYEFPSTLRHVHITHVSWWESGQHTLRIKIRRKDGVDSWHPSNPCTVYIGKVTGVTGPNAACTYEWPTFRVTTDPAGYYGGVVWKVDGVQRQVGHETFMYSWIYTGTKTVTACLGDSCASKEIEIITGLTVVPQEAYVGLGDSKIFEAWVCDEGGSAVKKTSVQGVEWSATRGDFTGDTYTPSSVSPSKGFDSVTAKYGGDEDSAVVTNFECDVTSADITVDNITVELKPADLSGTFKLELVAPDTDVIIENETRNSGTHAESFDIPNLEYVEEHTTIRARWSIGGSSSIDRYPYHIKVLGIYRHSRYNLPNEACYSGSNENFCYTAGNCTATECSWSTDGSARSDFLDAEHLNGSGYSSSLGYVTTEEWCQANKYPPPGGCTGHLLRDLSIAGGCPHCSGENMIANETVAVNASHPDLGCTDSVFVYTVGTRTVTDHGGGLGIEQLDHFIGLDTTCEIVGDIGNLMTIKLY